MADSKLVIKHKFKNVLDMNEEEEMSSEEEMYGGVPWSIYIQRSKQQLSLYLRCHKCTDYEKWSIEAYSELKMISKDAIKSESQKRIAIFGNTEEGKLAGWGCYTSWDRMKTDFVVNGCVTVEATVKIKKMIGMERIAMKMFDKSTKELSDTTLIVGDKKFYVSKLFLASQSAHFKSLLLEDQTPDYAFPEKQSLPQRLLHKTAQLKSRFTERFKEAGRTEVTLENVDANDFQLFLEVLYGEPVINDDTVERILGTSKTFKTDTVTRRCEEFLIQKSVKILQKKFDISLIFELENLKNECVDQFESVKEMRTAIPSDLAKIDRALLEQLFLKSLSF